MQLQQSLGRIAQRNQIALTNNKIRLDRKQCCRCTHVRLIKGNCNLISHIINLNDEISTEND